MRPIKLNGLVALTGSVLLLSACSTQTRLETAWSPPGLETQSFKEVAIIGTMRNESESNAFESAAVERFEKAGVNALPGFSILNDEKKLSREEMESRVAASGADAVLFFKVIAVDRDNLYARPTPYRFDGALYPDWWEDRYWGYYHPYPFGYWGYWYPAMQVTGSPGYWQTFKTYRIESALYRVSDGKLVWTATSETFDPIGQVDLAQSVAAPVLKDLEAHHLVA